MIRAYIFDLDGTLVDSEVIWVEAVGATMRDHAGEFSQEEAAALVYGRSWRDIHADIVVRFPALDMPIHEMEATIAPYYKAIADRQDIRIPNSIALLHKLSKAHPVCIVSGSSRKTISEAVDMMGIADALDFFLGADDYSPGKPDPTCYRMAAERLGVMPEECLVFEDSEVGLRSAKGAGMACVILTGQARPVQDFSSADLVLDDLGKFDVQALG
jgi:HAD superfamily hydrolase (TIGR01509 family)